MVTLELRFDTVGLLFVGCLQKDKCYADKPETMDALKDNIREAIGEIQLHTIDIAIKVVPKILNILFSNEGFYSSSLLQ